MENDKNDLGAQSATGVDSACPVVPTDTASHAAPTFTPGPWRVSMSGYSVKSLDDDMPIVASNPWGAGMKEKNIPRWLANADLIAASPDLYAALLELVEAGKFAVDSCDDVAIMLRLGQATDAAHIALAKANGR